MSDLHLPLDICRKILLRLPGGSLFRFRAVCKPWRTVIDDPSFAWAHTFDNHLSSSSSDTTLVIKETLDPDIHNLYTFDLDAVNLFTDRGDQAVSGSILSLTLHESRWLLGRLPVSTCNGLLLVYPFGLNPLEIWNLSTRERLQLPHVDTSRSGTKVLFGLGYDQAAQDLKAVVIYTRQAHVYSLRSDAWTMTIIDDGLGSSVSLGGTDGVFLCGAILWLINDNEMLALDVGTGKHRHIQVDALEKTLDITKRLDVLGGCLVVSGFSSVSQYFDVWVMKGYGSDDESWAKLLSVVVPRTAFYDGFGPVAYFKDRNQVLLKNDDGSEFFVFDVKSDSMKTLFTGRYCLTAQIIPQSILRLRDHCGGSGTSRIITMPQPRRVSFTF